MTLTAELNAHRLDRDLTYRQLSDAIHAATGHRLSISNLHGLCTAKPADAAVHDRTAHHLRKYLAGVKRATRRRERRRGVADRRQSSAIGAVAGAR